MNENQQNPYSTEQEQNGTTDEKAGLGFGIASMVLGIISLLCFCTCINIIPAILAIVFGIIQIMTREHKGMAIAGIVTGALSICLLIGCYALAFSNAAFVNMVENEMVEEFNRDEIEDIFEHYMPEPHDVL